MGLQILTDQFSIKDNLEFQDFQIALKDIIVGAGTPITIGVFGSWGTGKTSLMRMLANEIQRNSSNRVVWFSAWKYDDEVALWRAFILRVIDALRPRDGDGNILTEEMMVDYQKNMVKDLDRLEESLYRTVEWKELGELTLDWGKAITNTTKLAAQLAFSFIPGAAPFVKTLEKAQELLAEGKPADDLEQVIGAFHRQVKEYRREQLRAVDQFDMEFGRVISNYVLTKGGRLVVFVDDLDRCLPEKSIDILEAIKLFLDVPGCVFVLGMDETVIEKGIELRYFKNTANDSAHTIFGEKYLEKMIQVPFRIPTLSPNSVVKFVDDLIDDMDNGNQIPLSCRRIIAIGCPNNPRQVKRAVNLLLILSKVVEERHRRGKLSHPISLPLLAKTAIIQTYFPDFYSDWVKFPTLIQQLEKIFELESVSNEYASSATNLSEVDTQAFLLQKYDKSVFTDNRLKEIITYGKNFIPTNSFDAEKFQGLARSQILSYFYLVQAGSAKEVKFEQNETQIWEDLLSGDLVKVNSASVQIIEAGEEIIKSYQNRLTRMIYSDDIKSSQKISVGMALSYLGDNRNFNDMIKIHPGEFVFGEENKKVTIGKQYSIGKFPVTVLQYKQFVDQHGYENNKYWTPEGWKWLQTWKINKPKYWDDPRLNLLNYPIVGVSWYEAVAYCNFTGGRLPTEQEWERVARGKEGRQYPWGDEFANSLANTSEQEIGSICPVGLFSKGVSDDGALDLAGQVWEWTSSEFAPSKYALKGGSWGSNSNYAKSSYRFGLNPEVRDWYVGLRIVKE